MPPPAEQRILAQLVEGRIGQQLPVGSSGTLSPLEGLRIRAVIAPGQLAHQRVDPRTAERNGRGVTGQECRPLAQDFCILSFGAQIGIGPERLRAEPAGKFRPAFLARFHDREQPVEDAGLRMNPQEDVEMARGIGDTALVHGDRREGALRQRLACAYCGRDLHRFPA